MSGGITPSGPDTLGIHQQMPLGIHTWTNTGGKVTQNR